jgi:hypothetical protein
MAYALRGKLEKVDHTITAIDLIQSTGVDKKTDKISWA